MMCEALNLIDAENLIKMASKLGKTYNGKQVNARLMQEFMQTNKVDRASTTDGIVGGIEPEVVRQWQNNHSFSPTEHRNLLSLFADNN